MRVLGISGSPIRDGNTDRALRAALSATGSETEFLKLIDYTVAPCKACLGCLKTNTCVINDDGILLAQKAKEADALIIAGYTPYSSLDSRTKAFIERLYPLRHIHGFMRRKPGGAIVTCAIPSGTESLPPAGDMGANAIMFYMMEEGMDYKGSVKVICGFKKSSFERLILQYPNIGLQVIKNLARRIDWLTSQAETQLSTNLQERLYKVLVNVAREHGTKGKGGIIIAFPLTHDELGFLLGVHRVSITRAMKALKESGKLIQSGRSLMISFAGI
jgi:multimeric flavodoxin WrbA